MEHALFMVRTMTATTVDPVITAAAHAKAEQLRRTLETLREQLSQRPKAPDVQPVANSPKTTIPPRPTNPNRPKSLDEVIGQNNVLMQLRTVIAGTQLRGEQMGHVLISGPAGTGKTSIAEVIASELGLPIISTTGMVLKKSNDLIGLLVKMDGPCILFVDECHAMSKVCIETTYTVLEDAKIDLLGGSGPTTVATTKALPGLIFVGATTAPGKLTVPFRDRFALHLQMQDYSEDELRQVVARFWKSRGVKHFKNEALQVARMSKGVPRNAVRLAGRVLDFAAVQGSPDLVTTGMVAEALDVFGIDANGLDGTDRRILGALTEAFMGKATGLDNLAMFLDIDPSTLSEQFEPWLVRRGLIVRTGRGRTATAAAYDLMRS
jgi:Holliday junction DNA helicase RuvB